MPDGDELPLRYTLGAGALSALVSSVVVTPFDVVKTRMQVAPSLPNASGCGRTRDGCTVHGSSSSSSASSSFSSFSSSSSSSSCPSSSSSTSSSTSSSSSYTRGVYSSPISMEKNGKMGKIGNMGGDAFGGSHGSAHGSSVRPKAEMPSNGSVFSSAANVTADEFLHGNLGVGKNHGNGNGLNNVVRANSIFGKKPFGDDNYSKNTDNNKNINHNSNVSSRSTSASHRVRVVARGNGDFLLSDAVPSATTRTARATFSHILKSEGFVGFWAGLGPSVTMSVPNMAIYLSMYETLKSSGFHPFLAGATGRIFASTATAPLEFIRTNIQAGGSGKDVIGKLMHSDNSIYNRPINSTGGRGTLWIEFLRRSLRGLGPTMARDVPFSAIYWAMYEYANRSIKAAAASSTPFTFIGGAVSITFAHHNDNDHSINSGSDASREEEEIHDSGAFRVHFDACNSNFAIPFLCGGFSGSTAALLTTPMDVVKTRVQTWPCQISTPSTLEIAREIVYKEGPSALMQGVTPRVLKVAPACAIMISAYEAAKAWFRVHGAVNQE